MQYTWQRRSDQLLVTVCVAAICDSSTVLGASDRMLTAGDVQFEPSQSKVWILTTSIAAMVAGDSSLQAEILHEVGRDMNARIQTEPSNWWLVKDAAQLYGRYFNEVRRKRSETTILAPLGLDYNTFISRQSEMSDALVSKIATELINFSTPSVAAIFAGTDPSGTHIYVCQDGSVECMDSVGFASIGIGRWHANSQFMFAQHDKSKPFPETLLLTYAAKKRAEVSPGVGKGTDMFTIGPRLGSYVKVHPDVVRQLEKMYRKRIGREKMASTRANAEVKNYVQNLIRAATPKEQEAKPNDSGGSAPADQENVRHEGAEIQSEG
jgi:hypothetical protein